MVRAPTILILPVVAALTGCFGVKTWSPTLYDLSDAAAVTPENGSFLKIHMASGELYVLSQWSQPSPEGRFSGGGWHYDRDRVPIEWRDDWTFEPDAIALLESNDRSVVSYFGLSGLVTYSVLSGLATAACLIDPKSCFGSCPTFYGEDGERPLAEGFSRSFARALEERDVDDLGLRVGPGAFSLLMRNEALETHAVRHVRIAAVPIGAADRVVVARDGRYHAVGALTAPLACASEAGDCLSSVLQKDDQEYAPLTDGTDLGSREEVILDFATREGPLGIVLSARQSLVSTFLFYQALAYAGSQAGTLLAALERGEQWAQDGALAIPTALGSIEVFVQEGNRPWEPLGVFDEAGPIATDTQVIPFDGRGGESLRVKLRMARGSWRVDHVALATLTSAPEALVLEPDSLTAPEGVGNAMQLLADANRYLVTTPGSELRLWFTLPEGPDRYALFLDTQGFYYEWMRNEWLPEEAAEAAGLMMFAPADALRALAPAFKRLEPVMEQLFWSSRFRR